MENLENIRTMTDFVPNIFHRLYGSYEALKGGNVADALTDFTGGITEGYILRGPNTDVPRNIVNILFKALDRQSLIGCGINVSNSVRHKI